METIRVWSGLEQSIHPHTAHQINTAVWSLSFGPVIVVRLAKQHPKFADRRRRWSNIRRAPSAFLPVSKPIRHVWGKWFKMHLTPSTSSTVLVLRQILSFLTNGVPFITIYHVNCPPFSPGPVQCRSCPKKATIWRRHQFPTQPGPGLSNSNISLFFDTSHVKVICLRCTCFRDAVRIGGREGVRQ